LSNPYETPKAALEKSGVDDTPNYWVEGKYLVVDRIARLPRRCLLSNVPIEGDALTTESVMQRELRLTHHRSFRIKDAFCRIHCSIAPEAIRRARRKMWLIEIPLQFIFLTLMALFWFKTRRIGMLFTLPFLGILLYRVNGVDKNLGLKIDKVENGCCYVSGVPKEFLQQLRIELAAEDANTHQATPPSTS